MRQNYHKIIKMLLVMSIMAIQTTLFAQNRSITGKVIDQSDQGPIPGVNILVKGTMKKAVSDSKGTFSIIDVSSGDILIFSSIGFITKEVAISSEKNGVLTVYLGQNAEKLSDVVVVGYGTQKKSDVTGAVATVDKKRLQDLPNTNFAQALQGSIPGISVSQGSGGAEGDGVGIRIRGRNSITANSNPFIILDGVPYTGGISDINPTDIESINVLKDASAAAIYGSRGANGVIIVTTKKGTRGKPVISYDGFYGIQNIANLPRILTPEEFYDFKKLREPNAITTSEQAVYDSKNFPDWLDLATRQGTRMQHTLGVSGGNENSRYFVSSTYLDAKGVAVNDNYKRLSTRVNLETNVTPWLTFSSNNQLSYSDRDGLPAVFSDESGAGAYRFNPLTTAFNPDGSPIIYPWPQDLFFGNPLAPTLAANTDKSYKIITNNYLNVDIPFIKGLSYRINTGVEYTRRDINTYYGLNTRSGLQSKGNLAISGIGNSNVLIENILNYNQTIGKHTIAVTGLYSYQNEIARTDNLSAMGFPNDVLTFYQANVANAQASNADFTKQVNISQMLRINYSFNSKYLLTLTGRRDGFSGFGSDNKFAFFPTVAIGWNISDENFMKDNKVIDKLKLRISYGSNGNQAIAAYNTLAQLGTRSYVDGSTTLPGYIPISLGASNLKWETTTGLNIGTDFTLLNGRIDGSVEFYSKNTKDLLLRRAISSVHGISNIVQNLGKTSNKGFEFGVNTVNVKAKDFTWTSNLNFSINRNKIKELYGDGKNDTLNGWFLGQPIDVNFAYKFDGVWQSGDDLTKSPQPNTLPGYAKVADINGDGKITVNNDRTIIGSRQPDFIYGIGNNFKYKNISLYLFIQGVKGTSRRNDIYSDNVQNGVRNNTYLKNWWSPTNPSNEYWSNSLGSNLYNVGIFESDSYARLKDASLAYDFSSALLKQMKISRLKIYASARNLFTITKWKGLDPELSNQEGIPLQKEFIFGLNISL
ncbi:TonB-dependent receptor [Pedobacter sp. Leaf194]|uniref:SusC/RagA family TonB-linked outer membrane protein n=1 Tax=Pedobacter sp. Leaf194 TaxID=1736297 RepID=UPI0007037DD2|nr:TonB-dependent receptor [Pedobacter sp. Leaf194]KQS36770.1 SusC/RagA family TonB-linked outer membrane protein [Pedobacter sp. Leaf194]